MSRYYDVDCCGVVTPSCPCPDEPLPVVTPPWDIKSFSHEFCGPAVLNNAALSAQSGNGGTVHQVDVDVRTDNDIAIVLTRGGAVDNLFCGGSRDWGNNLGPDNQPLESNDFEATLAAGQCVVVSWEEF